MLFTIENKQFYRVKLSPVVQKGNAFYIGVVPAKHIVDNFTVEPVEYDIEREKAVRNAYPNLSEYIDKSLAEKEALTKKTGWEKLLGFQRKYDPKRVDAIGKFICNEEYSFFPNTIIATCELINSTTGYEGPFCKSAFDEVGLDSNLSLFEIDDQGDPYLYFPLVEKSLLIIDGQHRLEGLKTAFEKYKLLLNEKEFDLVISFMLDYDRSVIAKLFYTINYTQKSVNKSVLYHLTGEFSRELNELAFLHETVKALNELSDSPFERRIKMLGRTPEKGSTESMPYNRELMTISQAALIDFLMYTLVDRKTKSLIQPIFLYYYKTGNHDIIFSYILHFFTCIRHFIPSWNTPHLSIISKTAGVGALARLMNYIFLYHFIEFNLFSNPLKIKSLIAEDKHFNGPISNILSVLSSCKWDRFAGDSSAGTLNKIKDYLVAATFGISEGKVDLFEQDFKLSYSVKFSEWLYSKT